MIMKAQLYVRRCEQENSAVSLRDVKRVILFINFFLSSLRETKDEDGGLVENLFVSAVGSGLALVYYFRFSGVQERNGFWVDVCDQNPLMDRFLFSLFFSVKDRFLILSISNMP